MGSPQLCRAGEGVSEPAHMREKDKNGVAWGVSEGD